MSDFVRAAHSRIRKHPRFWTDGINDHAAVDPALVYPMSRLLSDLSELPESRSDSKVFILEEEEVGLSDVRLFVRSEEQPYLRGAINALECLIERHGLEKLKSCGIVCQEHSMVFMGWKVQIVVADPSVGPHAEDVAIAASAYGIPTYIADLSCANAVASPGRRVSKVVLAVENTHIDGQKVPASTQDEPVPFPLHHHAEVVHGNGTIALQLEQEITSSVFQRPAMLNSKASRFDAVIGDMGNGCTLSGVCMAFSGSPTQVFGAAPSSGFWEHAASLRHKETPMTVKTNSEYWKDTEIMMGAVPWSVFTSSGDLAGVFYVDDEAMNAASLKVFEHSGLRLHPDEVVPLAVALYNQDFRRLVTRRLKTRREWTIGVVLQPRKSTLTGHVSQLGAELSASVPFR